MLESLLVDLGRFDIPLRVNVVVVHELHRRHAALQLEVALALAVLAVAIADADQ